MRAVLAGLALVALAGWGSHQLDPQHGLDIEAMVHAGEHAPTLTKGGCLAHADGYWVVPCTSPAAELRALVTTRDSHGADCPRTTTSLIRETHIAATTDTYWCVVALNSKHA